jgi:hypothetical protein
MPTYYVYRVLFVASVDAYSRQDAIARASGRVDPDRGGHLEARLAADVIEEQAGRGFTARPWAVARDPDPNG